MNVPTDEEIEDAEDAAIYTERKAALEAGTDKLLSAEVSALILSGMKLEDALRRASKSSK